MSSSSSPPPLGLLPSADGSAGVASPLAEGGEAEVESGADSAEADGLTESLLAVEAGTAVAGAAGAAAGVGAGAWKADRPPPPISLRRKFAASASFLSQAKYAWDQSNMRSGRGVRGSAMFWVPCDIYFSCLVSRPWFAIPEPGWLMVLSHTCHVGSGSSDSENGIFPRGRLAVTKA